MPDAKMDRSLERRYELRDAPAKTLLWFALGLSLTVLAVLAFCWLQYDAIMETSPATRQTDASAWSYASRSLKGIKDDRRELQAETRQRLESYQWIDREAGIVRIPIDRAMRIAAEQGLPNWGESNSQLRPIDMIHEKAEAK